MVAAMRAKRSAVQVVSPDEMSCVVIRHVPYPSMRCTVFS